MATRLTKLDINEISGVENPANELPGWLVTKAKKGDGELDVDTLIKEVDRAESDFAILYSALKSCETYLADAPPEVQAAKDTLVSYIEELFGGDGSGADQGDVAPDQGGDIVAQSKDKDKTKTLFGKLFRKGDAEEEKGDAEVEKNEDVKADEAEAEVEKADEPEAEAEVEKADETAKVDEPEVEVEKSEVDAEELLKSVKAAVGEALEPLTEDVGVVKDALGSALDRIGRLEAGRQGLDPDEVASTHVDKSEDGAGKRALRAGISAAARGGRVTLS